MLRRRCPLRRLRVVPLLAHVHQSVADVGEDLRSHVARAFFSVSGESRIISGSYD